MYCLENDFRFFVFGVWEVLVEAIVGGAPLPPAFAFAEAMLVFLCSNYETDGFEASLPEELLLLLLLLI